MDAMQKKRSWKVAISYLAISLSLVFTSFLLPEDFNPSSSHSLSEILSQVFMPVFVFMQPQFFLLIILQTNPAVGLINAIEFWSCVILIPIWSFCLGWLFVKFENWLNHFPVLGRRVF